MSSKTIGVLALQGDFEAHLRAVSSLGAGAAEVRTAAQLDACGALIIPGGESSTMLKLLELENLTGPLRRFGQSKPILGTCAGAILLAHRVTHPEQASLDLLDIDVERNAYGRQLDSRIARLETPAGPIEAVFIRAPIIRRTGPGVTVLATYLGDPVWVAEGRHMAVTFHPELSGTAPVHRRFLETLPA